MPRSQDRRAPGEWSSSREEADGLHVRCRGLVFPGIRGNMVGAAVFGRLLRDLKIDCSPHGFRSSFPSWWSDEGIDREVAEQALAHAVGSQVEQCYARSDVLERRREVIEAWGAFWSDRSRCLGLRRGSRPYRPRIQAPGRSSVDRIPPVSPPGHYRGRLGGESEILRRSTVVAAGGVRVVGRGVGTDGSLDPPSAAGTVVCDASGSEDQMQFGGSESLSANVGDTGGIPLNSGGQMLARRIDGKRRAETWRRQGVPDPGGRGA